MRKVIKPMVFNSEGVMKQGEDIIVVKNQSCIVRCFLQACSFTANLTVLLILEADTSTDQRKRH